MVPKTTGRVNIYYFFIFYSKPPFFNIGRYLPNNNNTIIITIIINIFVAIISQQVYMPKYMYIYIKYNHRRNNNIGTNRVLRTDKPCTICMQMCTYEYSRSLNGFQIVFRLFRNQNYANLIIIGRRGYYIIIVYTGSGVIVPGADDGCLQFPKTIYCTRKLLQVTYVTTYLPISTVWCTLDVIRVCTRTSYYYNYDVLTQHDTFIQCL